MLQGFKRKVHFIQKKGESTLDKYNKLEELRTTKGKMIDKLKLLNKNMKVFVWDYSERKYIDNFNVWVEGHDHRHFIELSQLKGKHENFNKDYTVGELLKDMKNAYSYLKSPEYALSVPVQVMNERVQYTSIMDFRIKDGNLYLIGKTPLHVLMKRMDNIK